MLDSKYPLQTYCIVSNALYPNGGGESYMRDTLSVLRPLFLSFVWIYFESTTKDNVVMRFQEISPGMQVMTINLHGFDADRLAICLQYVKPSVVHHQGSRRLEVSRTCFQLKIPLLTGFHFWNDLVSLDSRLENKQILQNISMSRIHPNFDEIRQKSFCYLVSPFMRDVVARVSDNAIPTLPVHPPIYEQLIPRCSISIKDRACVGQLNVHPSKGGEIALTLLRSTVEFYPPVCFCVTESRSNQWYKEFETAFQSYPQQEKTRIDWTNDPVEIYAKCRIVLVPSVVDETFCRVAWEAMAAGCVVVCSDAGNLPNIVQHGVSGIVLPVGRADFWVDEIKRIYNDVPLCAKISAAGVERANQLVTGQQNALCKMVSDTIKSSPRTNFGIITVWGDQGLGIQSRVYVDALVSKGMNASIFSFTPYNALNYKRNAEWDRPDVYYSPNIREKITKNEITLWVNKNNLGIVMIPEICFLHIFQVTRWLQAENVRVIAIPNIEICRSSELMLYGMFDRIIANNIFTTKILKEKYDIESHLVGFDMPVVTEETTQENSDLCAEDIPDPKVVSFLLIGGNNPFYRKNAHKVLDAFVALPADANFRLTVTLHISDRTKLHRSWLNHPRIRLINKHLSYQAVNALYKSHRIYVQLSTNEGLGINMYEAKMHGNWVITHDFPPYNEVVTKEGHNRFLPSHQITMLDNSEAIISSCDFSCEDLIRVARELIVLDPPRGKTSSNHNNLNYSAFAERLYRACVF
jgi:glycosyltransferase involved in cell wall biosynthesis